MTEELLGDLARCPQAEHVTPGTFAIKCTMFEGLYGQNKNITSDNSHTYLLLTSFSRSALYYRPSFFR